MPKISHKQKSRKHRSRRTKKYTRKQKGGTLSRQGAVRARGAVKDSKKIKKEQHGYGATNNTEHEEPLPPIPTTADARPVYAPYTGMGKGKGNAVVAEGPSDSGLYTPYTGMGKGNTVVAEGPSDSGLYTPYTGMGMGKGKAYVYVSADSLYKDPKGTIARAAEPLPNPHAPPLPLKLTTRTQ